MRKKAIIKGAAILMLANLITRLMGFYYRTCMVKTIGAEGMGLYQLIVPLYILSWSITSSGLTTTISKLTSAQIAKKQSGNAVRILYSGLLISTFVSIGISLIFYLFADTISFYIIKDQRGTIPIQILSFAIPFMALGSCIRGYFTGIQKQEYPALSQILEQIVRISSIFILSSLFLDKGIEYSCSIALVGIVLGEGISFLFILFCFKSMRKKTKLNMPSLSKQHCIMILFSMAMPLTMSRIMGSLLSAVENILIPQRLSLFSASENVLATFGSLTGMAMPLIQLPCAILTALSVTIIPAISETEAMSHKKQTSILIEKSLCFTTIIGCGVFALFASFPNEICTLVYNDVSLGSMLVRLSIIAPFMYLSITLNGILNGLGCHSFILGQNILSSIVNISFIYFLMPKYGIDAFIAGAIISLLITTTMDIKMVSKKNPLSLSFYKNFFTPAVCAVSTYVVIKLLPPCTSTLEFLAYGTLLGLIYLFLLLLSETITMYDILTFLPKKPPV